MSRSHMQIFRGLKHICTGLFAWRRVDRVGNDMQCGQEGYKRSKTRSRDDGDCERGSGEVHAGCEVLVSNLSNVTPPLNSTTCRCMISE